MWNQSAAARDTPVDQASNFMVMEWTLSVTVASQARDKMDNGLGEIAEQR